jgi:hypothetical protein
MGYTAGYNFDVSNLDSDFYKKLSAGTPIANPYKLITINSGQAADAQIQSTLNNLNDLFIDDSVKVVIKFSGICGSFTDATQPTIYHKFETPVLIDHPIADRLVIEGQPPSDHSILGVSYYDAVDHQILASSNGYYTNSATAAERGFYAQFVITNGNGLQIGEYLGVYDNRYQKYLNPSFYQFKDTVNGRVFATPYPVTAEKLRASLIVGVHRIVDKIDVEANRPSIANPGNKVDYVTVLIENPNPTYSIGLSEYTIDLARRGYLTPQGIVGRYEQGYGTSTILEDPLSLSGLSSGISGGEDIASIPGYRNASHYNYGELRDGVRRTYFNETYDNTQKPRITSQINANEQGLFGLHLIGATAFDVGSEWERYERLAQESGENLSVRNYRDSNDFRAKGFKSIIQCSSDGFIIANCTKPPEIKNLVLVGTGGIPNVYAHGIRVENSSSVNLRQVAVVGFSQGAGIFANNKSSVNIISDKFSDPEVFRQVGVFSCKNYTGFESRNHSNINCPRSIGAGNRFANYYASENSYINAYASVSVCSERYGIVAVGKSFINADSAFSCFNGSDGFLSTNGSLLTINSGRACYNYGNGVHAFSSGEIRAFDIIVSSNKKDGIVANDMSTIICGDSSKEPIEWDLFYGYETPYYKFENPTNISQSRFNGISGLASSTDSFVNASFFETSDNSRLAGELGRLKGVDCVYNQSIGYCYGGSSAGYTCDAAFAYCDNAIYDPAAFEDGNTNAMLNALTPTNVSVASLCIPYTEFSGLTAQVPVSKTRYSLLVQGLESEYGQAAGLTISKILGCKGYLPGCGVRGSGADVGSITGLPGVQLCTPTKTPQQILEGATGSAEDSFVILSNVLACTGDSISLLTNIICLSESNIDEPKRPLTLVIPNYDVEVRDSAKVAFAGRVANFGYYDIKTGVRIQPLYRGTSNTNLLLKPATLIGYSGNRNGSELVITDQTTLETGILGQQGADSLDPRDAKYRIRYSSEDFLSAAELYDPVAQVGFVNTSTYILNLGKKDPETGALLTNIGTTAGEILINNTSFTPQISTGTNEQSTQNGYPTY